MEAPQKHFAGAEYRDVDGILQIVKDGLCHKCGACLGVCPANTFGKDEDGYPIQVADCIHCNICVQTCSGWHVDYDRIGDSFFAPGVYEYGSLMGAYRNAYVAHAADEAIRTGGGSGGVVTGLLVHLLESGQIKGALVSIQDPENPFLGKGIIARTREEILSSGQSIYTTTPAMEALSLIRDAEGPLAVVAVPCQIHSLRHRQLVDPRLKNKISLVFGLHCSITPPASSSRELARIVGPKGVKPVSARYRQHRDGEGQRWPNNTMEIGFEDGTLWRSPLSPTQTFNVVARIGNLGRCMTCVDQTAEFCDVAFADPWIRDEKGHWKYHKGGGWTSALVRTDAGEKAMQSGLASGALVGHEIDPIEIQDGQKHVINAKKLRVGMRLKIRQKLGRKIPRYPMDLPLPNFKTIKKEILWRSIQAATTFGPIRYLAVKIVMSPLGKRIMDGTMAMRRRQFRKGHLN